MLQAAPEIGNRKKYPKADIRFISSSGHWSASGIYRVIEGLCDHESSQGQSAKFVLGDLMIVMEQQWVGVQLYPQLSEPGFVSQHVGICRLPKSEVNPYFALWSLRSPQGQEQLLGQRDEQGKPGLNLVEYSRSEDTNPATHRTKPHCQIPRRTADESRFLKKLQEETAEELDALMPSILSRAFSGDL